ncbi:MAG: hypothetical protein ACPGUH_07165 [Winogradskyella sp.]
MKRIIFFALLCFITSCNYFENKKVNSEDVLEAQLQTFNWNAVDTYPTFTSCDTIIEKEAAKICFQNVLLNSVNNFLEAQRLVVFEDINDTITLHIEINKQGVLSVKAIDLKPKTALQIPKIDSLLRASLTKLPKIYPAIKQAQQVTTEFQLPVIVKIKD